MMKVNGALMQGMMRDGEDQQADFGLLRDIFNMEKAS